MPIPPYMFASYILLCWIMCVCVSHLWSRYFRIGLNTHTHTNTYTNRNILFYSIIFVKATVRLQVTRAKVCLIFYMIFLIIIIIIFFASKSFCHTVLYVYVCDYFDFVHAHFSSVENYLQANHFIIIAPCWKYTNTWIVWINFSFFVTQVLK